MKSRWISLRACGFGGLLGIVLFLTGCAFDVVSLNQKPASFTAVSNGSEFILLTEVTAHLGTGFPTRLRSNTRWKQMGATEQGQIFSTKDQVVKVEASNISEAYIVVNGQTLVGFYLPIEKTFVPATSPVLLTINRKS